MVNKDEISGIQNYCATPLQRFYPAVLSQSDAPSHTNLQNVSHQSPKCLRVLFQKRERATSEIQVVSAWDVFCCTCRLYITTARPFVLKSSLVWKSLINLRDTLRTMTKFTRTMPLNQSPVQGVRYYHKWTKINARYCIFIYFNFNTSGR